MLWERLLFDFPLLCLLDDDLLLEQLGFDTLNEVDLLLETLRLFFTAEVRDLDLRRLENADCRGRLDLLLDLDKRLKNGWTMNSDTDLEYRFLLLERRVLDLLLDRLELGL